MSVQFGLILQKFSAGKQKDASSSLLRPFATIPREARFFRNCWTNALQLHFYGTWTLTTLGRTAEVYSVLTLPIVLEGFSWGIHEKEKLHLNWDYSQHRDSKTSEFILDLGLIQLCRPAQRCSEATRARLSFSRDTEKQSILNTLMPTQGKRASRWQGHQWNDLQARPEKKTPRKKLNCRCQGHPNWS